MEGCLRRFGLTKFYPSKITIQVARKNAKTEVSKDVDIPWYFIGKTLSGFNQEGWYTLLEQIYNDASAGGAAGRKTEQEKKDGKKKATGFAALLDNEDEDEKEKQSKNAEAKAFHLDDLKLAVFLCSDNILKKILAQKLFFSKLSVPFVLPDIEGKGRMQVQWWAFRGMRTDVDFAHAPAALVSIIRCTDLPISRYEVLNRLIFDKSHDTFYKAKEKSIDTGKDLSSWANGCIDVGVYQKTPCRCKQDESCTCSRYDQECILFFNLFGNCKKSPLQKKMICQLSSVVVVFVDAARMDGEVIDRIINIVRDARQTLLVITKDDQASLKDATKRITSQLGKRVEDEKLVEKMTILLLFDQDTEIQFNPEKMESQMIKKLKKALENCQLISSLKVDFDNMDKDLNKDGKDDVISDDDEEICVQGKKAAESIRDKLEGLRSLAGVKEREMPLQMNEWVKWSTVERNLRSEKGKLDDESPEEFICRMEKDQSVIRKEQIERLRSRQSPIMKMFCETISDRISDISEYQNMRNYFLHWLKIFLVEICSSEVHELRTELNQLHGSDIKSSRKRSAMDEATKIKAQELRNKIRSISLDVRHFVREMGQIVEAYLSSGDDRLIAEAERYTEVMGTLFVQGFTLEIFDSTAKQVPIKFLTSVFQQVKSLSYGKVFVLSILGIQSSGKSTMLNALFGTQFDTSIGLCTEGVNVQLLPIPAEKRKNDYKYILLIDTKGLLATDRDATDPHSGENELATLIFGLSDLTILNIMGAPKTVVGNLLQVVAHAMLKIKKVNTGVNIHPKCLFIHHNVDEASAAEALRNENETFMEELDKIVHSVAGRIGLPDKQFSDLIDFDVDHDNIYIPHLWQGTPPMATISSAYTKEVSNVLNMIYDEIMPNVKGFQADINAFSVRLKSLWEAILSTNFVFSFRNHLEINAYETLEAKFNNLRWNLNSAVTRIYNEIKSKDISGEEKQRTFINERMNAELATQQDDLSSFFLKTSEGSLLQDSKLRYENLLVDLAKEKEKTVIKFLMRDLEVSKRRLAVKESLGKWKTAATKIAREAAEIELKRGDTTAGKKSKIQLELEFSQIWKALKEKLPKVEVDVKLPEIVKSVMKNVGNLTPAQLKEVVLTEAKSEELVITLDHFFIAPGVKIPAEVNISEMINREVTSKICHDVYDYLKDINDDIFDKSYAEQTFQIALRHINTWHNNYRQQDTTSIPGVQLTEAYKVAILTHIANMALPYFREMQEAYQRRLDASADEFEPVVKGVFLKMINILTNEQAAANILCERIKQGLRMRVDMQLKKTLPDDIRANNYIMGSKQKFEVQVMKDILEVDNFEEYISFVRDGPEYSLRRLKHHVDVYLFFNKKVFADIAINEARKMVNEMSRVLGSNTSTGEDMGTAVLKLVRKLSVHLPNIDEDETIAEVMSNFTSQGSNFVMFFKYFASSFANILDTMNVDYKSMTSLSRELEKHVLEQLGEHLQGCTVRCPFCTATCSNPMKEHTQDHHTSHHYPVCLNGFAGKTADGQLSVQTCAELVTSGDKFRMSDVKVKIPLKQRFINLLRHGTISYRTNEIQFKDYKTIYTDWKIDSRRPRQENLFWKRFLGKFSSQLAQYHGCAPPDHEIIQKWSKYTKSDVVHSMRI